MNRQQIAEIALRLMGVYFVVYAMAYLPYICMSVVRLVQSGSSPVLIVPGAMWNDLISNLLTPAMYVATGAGLVLYSSKLARFLFRDESMRIESVSFTKLDAFRIALPLLGVSHGFYVVGTLTSSLFSTMTTHGGATYRGFISEPWFWSAVVQLAIVAVMIFKAEPIGLRLLGRPQPDGAFPVEEVQAK